MFEPQAQRALSAITGSICLVSRTARATPPRPGFLIPKIANFSTTTRQAADSPLSSSFLSTVRAPSRTRPGFRASDYLKPDNRANPEEGTILRDSEPYHFHIMATKHNTHITLTKPNRDPIISVSCGSIGFRKAGRSSYDAAYQLGAYVLSTIQDRGLLPEINELELVFRGFGEGREAVKKVIMGSEGMIIRKKIIRVTDATRLKFGGARSKKPRRLG